jgi:hypothetical protein
VFSRTRSNSSRKSASRLGKSGIARLPRKRIRPTTAPEISAGVMTANIIWKVMKARCGTVAAYSAFGASPTPDRPTQASPPSSGVPGAKASE